MKPSGWALFFLRDRSVVDHEPHKLGVVGSIPAPATTLAATHGGSAMDGSSFVAGYDGWSVWHRFSRFLFGVPLNRRTQHKLSKWLAVSHPQWNLPQSHRGHRA